MEGTIGEIRLFAGNFAPRGWFFCDGTNVSIAEYSPLFAIIGDIYGGNGVTTFQLPDLRSRVAVGTGKGENLPNIDLGQIGGSETATMTINQMPAHNHLGSAVISIPAYAEPDTASSTNSILASLSGAYSAEGADTHLAPVTAPVTLGVAGGSVPFNIIQPSMAMNYIICAEGIFPTRS